MQIYTIPYLLKIQTKKNSLELVSSMPCIMYIWPPTILFLSSYLLLSIIHCYLSFLFKPFEIHVITISIFFLQIWSSFSIRKASSLNCQATSLSLSLSYHPLTVFYVIYVDVALAVEKDLTKIRWNRWMLMVCARTNVKKEEPLGFLAPLSKRKMKERWV